MQRKTKFFLFATSNNNNNNNKKIDKIKSRT